MSSLYAEPRSINYGLRARLGMLLPSENTIAEPQINAMLPPGVSLHATRLQLRGESGNVLSMLDWLEEGASLLAYALVDSIIFHCTAVSMWSLDIPAQIARRVAKITDIPVIITSEAILDALRALGARRIVLVTPYVQEMNDREVGFLGHHGVEVLRERGLQIASGIRMAAVEPGQWYREVLAMRDPAADAYFISCTTIRSAEVIDALESKLQRPVLTSNQAVLWRALRDVGINDRIDGFGTLLREERRSRSLLGGNP